MAQKVEIILVDDLDGGPADETVRFGIDGVQYEIDLSSAHAHSLRESLAPYADKGRKTAGRAARTTKAAAPSRNQEAAQVREWARNNGFNVSARGRVNREILEAYRQAHQ